MKKLLLLVAVLINVYIANSTSHATQASQSLLKKVTTQNYSLREIPLDQYTTLKNFKTKIGKNGKTHTKFEQAYKGIPVDNLVVILHKIGDKLSWSGKIVPELNIDVKPTLSEQEAKQLAIASANVKHPIWEIEAYENLKKKTENDLTATNKPQGELVIYDGNYSYNATQYRLAYKFQIFSVNPLSHKTIYVDANTGIILGNKENTHNCSETCNSKTVSGPTDYSSEVDFDVCCDENGCYLESSDGCDIIIYDAKESYSSPQNCVTDSNGSFDDPTANEVFWATQQYCKFLSDVFDRKGIDDDDHPLIAYVHYAEDHNNAYWWNNATYFGDGDGEYASSFTSIDIVAHEFTHGLNDYTANLVYENEPGALDESFADIFGLLLEQYINGETDWKIGNDFMIQYSALRNFVNPKDATLRRKKPNTYLGEYYYTGDDDNGGVHTNSSVQNYWFYLLSEGGSGVNDNGYVYNIEGIGIDKAAEIVYSNLTNYLFSRATFMDAREGAIQAAEDIFGEDSFEVKQTELAWCAVGVGECDLSPSCRLNDSLVLIDLYNATKGWEWDIQWDLEKAIDKWHGIVLNKNGCVEEINLSSNNLTGFIPESIGNLKYLKILGLQFNNLSGNIPDELTNLASLENLLLQFNNLTGNLPINFGNLINLKSIELSANKFTGIIPPSIGNLVNLESFSISNTDITGTLPDELGNLTNLKFFRFADNYSFGGGNIPTSFGNLINLEILNLVDNNLDGEIPFELGFLKNLKELHLTSNNLIRSIPASFSQLDSIEILYLFNNNLSGCFPSKLRELCRIDFNVPDWPVYGHSIDKGNDFDTSWEDFCANGLGQCEESFCNDRETLIEVYNALGGSNSDLNWDLSEPMDTWDDVVLNELGCVEALWLSDKNLEGVIPSSIGNLSSLENLDLRYNNISGEIPSEIYNLKKLKSLVLNDNQINGSISPLIGNLTQLDFLNLSNNLLSGTIPFEIAMLENLTQFWCNNNNLSGEIPNEIDNLSKLEKLSLAGNSLSRKIPNEIGSLVNLEYLHIQDNQLGGCFSTSLKVLCEQLDVISIDTGNNFDANWEDFCAKEEGICTDAFVLPGDFNNDGCLSYTDVLYWGLGEGNTGPARENASNEFVPQLAEDWEGDVNGINSKHQDANGDGIVNKDDLYVFVDNYIVEDNRCNKNNTRVSEDHLSFVRVEKVSNISFEESETREITYEVYVDSKIENMDVGLHGFELEFQMRGFGEILNVALDATPFNAEVDTVTSLTGENKEFVYKMAITRTDKGNSIFDKNSAAAILVVTIEDLPTGEERELKEFVSAGSFTVAGSGAMPLPLQGASTFVSTENDFSANIIPSPGKGIVEVIINKNNEIIRYVYESAPGAESCEALYNHEFNTTDCSLNVSDGCSINATIPLEPGNCIIDDLELYNLLPIQLHPNPTHSKIAFTLNSEYCGRQIDKIEIFDVAGYLVQKTEMYNRNVCTYNIDVNELSNGIYFINIFNGDSILKGKFMKL